ncbi:MULTISPECIES: hypothetical protein [unclassified Mesorhizobium]|uniref:hypothetical protein n=1 Tax=unclassified Mesorhizobium TaxID=325217 RepID=UPI00167727A4|nr:MULTISPECIES: hypothetical protein [unclassified Mesorhizobium]
MDVQQRKMALEPRSIGRLQEQEIEQFSKAATSGQGNRKQRRAMQADLKKMMRKR